MKRRDWLKVGGAAFGLLGLPKRLWSAEDCGVFTPEQTEGPFYPENPFRENDEDLTVLWSSRDSFAKGQRVLLSGEVVGPDCRPIEGARVEIWQACESGAYDHSLDPNTAERDPHFQYWGVTRTDQNGRYSFRTIKPGAYPASPEWIRPPHIHFKVRAPGFPSLTTQMYFSGDMLLAQDRILAGLSEEQRQSVIVNFTRHSSSFADPNSATLVGFFRIRLGATPELH